MGHGTSYKISIDQIKRYIHTCTVSDGTKVVYNRKQRFEFKSINKCPYNALLCLSDDVLQLALRELLKISDQMYLDDDRHCVLPDPTLLLFVNIQTLSVIILFIFSCVRLFRSYGAVLMTILSFLLSIMDNKLYCFRSNQHLHPKI